MTLTVNHGIIDSFTLIRRERKLPRPGEVLKRPGQSVSATDVVARARVPQGHHIIDVVAQLRVPVEKVNRYVLKRPGEQVEEGEPVAARRSLVGLRRIMARSPIEGEVVEVGGGIVLLEGEPQVIEVRASVSGSVVESLAPWGIIVETQGAWAQLAWGHGEMAYSELKVLTPTEDGLANANILDAMEHRGTIVSVPAPLTEDFLNAAAGASVQGVIGSSMDASLIPLVDELELTIGISEGFGQAGMSKELAELLRVNAGRQMTLDPGSDEGWRFSRPEIIIPMPGEERQTHSPEHDRPLGPGQRVRILRGLHAGAVGHVAALPDFPRQLPSGLWAMGADVQLGKDEATFVPFANLEHLG